MNKVNISLLLPTRGRPNLVYQLLNSVTATTCNPKGLEVVLYIDEDDLGSHEISYPALSVVKLIRPRNTMGNINRACYEASSGRYVMVLNDDVVFRTPNWDVAVLNATALFPDDIALVYGNDLLLRRHLATFPIVSRTVCELIGGICPPTYERVFIDVHLLDIFKRLSRLGYPRIVYLKDVIFEHMHFWKGKDRFDETYRRSHGRMDGPRRVDDMLFIALKEERQYRSLLLAQYIRMRQNNSSGFNRATLDKGIESPRTSAGTPTITGSTCMDVGIKTTAEMIKVAYNEVLADNRLPLTWKVKLFLWITLRSLFSWLSTIYQSGKGY